ncbi:LysR family transcriptional regulator [Pseudoalteromonas tunicata]|uniref:LysR family transcriptional regulator n=1 Tax=Pseudoalteromonas tunicata TaxID=314281 RepID=UPI00273F5C6E|nr:LysR family transcriptional regulator [Pseudoalteromonas tunicata]MDP5214132.1 LysR family transcriptional regulator [Pseudoalteromonas tunicata]
MLSNQLFDGIEIFVQVVKCGSFNAAASVLSHSSSHISKEISKLESRIGVRLMNRTTRSLSLTPEGEAYFQQCVQLISDAEQAVSLITADDVQPKGTLKISCPIGFSQQYLQSVIAQYLDMYPNVTLEWDLSDKRIDLIADGYDLAIRASEQLVESSLICKRVFHCKAHVVVSKGYIEKYGRPHHPRELAAHHCICYSNLKMPGRWDFVERDGTPFQVDVRQKVRCNNGQMQLALVQAHQGITRLPAFYLNDALQSGELEVLFCDYKEPEVNVYAIYPSRKHLSPKVRCFIDLLSSSFAQ